MKNRFLASVIDMAISCVPILILGTLSVLWGSGGSAPEALAAQVAIVLGVAFAVISFGTLNLIQGLRKQQTPGQKHFGLRVCSDEYAAGQVQVFRRFLAGLLAILIVTATGFPPLILLYPAWTLIDKEGRSLADIISGTTISKFVPE